MKTHTNTFKDNLTMFGKQIDAKITYTLNNQETILTNEDVNSIQPITQGDLLKSIMKELYIDSNIEIPKDTEIQFEFGLYNYNDDEYEYINFGKYYVAKSEYQEDTRSYYITCYDKMINSMIDYDEVAMIYPTTVRSYINELCETIGIEFANASDNFANYDKEIPTDLYKGLGYTYRNVLDELSQATASNICINANNQLEIRYISDTNETFDEEYFSEDNVMFGKKIGKINSIVLSRSAESDNVYLRDEESVQQNGLYEIKIVDNQIMNFNNRAEFLPDILEKLDNLEFYSMDVNSTGICYLDVCDRYTISVNNNSYTCVLMNDEININQGLEENIYVEEPKVSETEYKYASETDRKINQTYLIVDKQNQKINAVVNQVDTLEGDLAHPTNQLTGKTIDIDDATNQSLLDFSMEGDLEQDSTTGKQLFDYYSYPTSTTTDGITITNNGDGTITLNGTSTSNALAFAVGRSANIQNYCAESPVTHTAYYVSGTCTKVSTSTTRTVIRLNYNQQRSMIHLEQLSANNNKLSATEPQNTSTTGWGWQIVIGEGDTFDNFKIRYGAELGSTSTDWEEFTGTQPSPNPDFAKDIHSVIGDNTIILNNKNLLNYNNGSGENNGITAVWENGEVVLNGTATSNAVIPINLDKGLDTSAIYTLSANNSEVNNDVSLQFRLGSSYSTKMDFNVVNRSRVYEIGREWKEILIRVANGTTLTNYKFKPQLEKGEVATNWVQYQSQSQKLSLGVDNLFSSQLEKGSIDTTTGNNITNNNCLRSVDYILVQPNTTYTISNNNNYQEIIYYYDETKTFIKVTAYNNGNQTFTTPSNCYYIRNRTSANSVQNDLTTLFQLEKGSKANSYSEYGVEPTELCKIGDYQDYIYETKGKWYKHKEINKVVLNGSESDWGSNQTSSAGISTNQYNGITDYLRIEDNTSKCNYFTSEINKGYGAMTYGKCYFRYNTNDENKRLYFGSNMALADFKTWLSTHPIEVYYVLAEEQEEEITNEELIDQLNSLMNIPLFKGINHITIDTFNLQPTINVEYKRDTDVNNNFSNRKDLDNYYTKVETNAQIQVASGSIMTEVSEVREAVSENSNSITTLTQTSSTLQTQTELLIDFKNNIDENGVDKVKTETNYTFNKDGLSIAKSGSNISSKIDNNALEIKEGNTAILFAGYNTTTQKTEVTSKEMIAEKITAGNHRCEIYNFENEDKTAWFYVG